MYLGSLSDDRRIGLNQTALGEGFFSVSTTARDRRLLPLLPRAAANRRSPRHRRQTETETDIGNLIRNEFFEGRKEGRKEERKKGRKERMKNGREEGTKE